MEVAKQMGAQLNVSFEFKVARLIHVGIFGVSRTISTWPYCAHGKGSHAIGSTHIKLLGIGG